MPTFLEPKSLVVFKGVRTPFETLKDSSFRGRPQKSPESSGKKSLDLLMVAFRLKSLKVRKVAKSKL